MASDVNLTEIKRLIERLDFLWFESKKSFCLLKYSIKVGSITPSPPEKVIIDYCWDSITDFKNPEAAARGALTMYSIGSDYDGKDITYEIIRTINQRIKNYTSPQVIYAVIEQALSLIKESIHVLKLNNDNDTYHGTLDHFLDKSRERISEAYKHITEQIILVNEYSLDNRVLTVEKCNSIAEIKLKKNSLITEYRGAKTSGEALFTLLTEKKSRSITDLKIWVEGWDIQAVYYLIYKLNKKLSDGLNIASIEKKRALFLKNKQLFVAGTYYSFVSKKLDVYDRPGTKKAAVDQQLDAIL